MDPSLYGVGWLWCCHQQEWWSLSWHRDLVPEAEHFWRWCAWLSAQQRWELAVLEQRASPGSASLGSLGPLVCSTEKLPSCQSWGFAGCQRHDNPCHILSKGILVAPPPPASSVTACAWLLLSWHGLPLRAAVVSHPSILTVFRTEPKDAASSELGTQPVWNTFSFYESAALWFIKIMVSQPQSASNGVWWFIYPGRICSFASCVSELCFIFYFKRNMLFLMLCNNFKMS